jgi:nucleotide-binding universal stress UspA family protein
LAGPTLATEIASWGPDLVVLATHGRGTFSRFWLGSVADFLLRHVSVPLLFLRPKDAMDWPPIDLHLKSILVATDLSSMGEAILEPVGDLAALVGATVEVVHVTHPWFERPSTPGFEYPDATQREETRERRKEAEHELAQVANRLTTRGLEVRIRLEVNTSVPETLIRLVNQGRHDLVALTTHGRSGIARVILGSVADKVVRGSDKPVLVVCPGPS